MQELLRRYAEFVVCRPWSVLGVALAATAIIAVGIGRLAVDLDPEKQLPADNPYIAVDRKIRKQFGGQNFVAIAVIPASGTIWRRDVLQVVYDLTTDLLNAPGVIRQNVLSLSSPYVRVPRDRDGVLVVDYVMKEVPADDAGVTTLRRVYDNEPLFKHALVSDDARAALVLADFYDGTPPAAIAATIATAVSKYGTAGLDIAATGAPLFDDVQTRIVRQQGAYFAGTVAAILLVLHLAFGQMQGVLLPSLTALLSTVWAMGFMGLAGISMNPWTASVPVVVMTVAAGHSAQMLKRYYEEFHRLGSQAAAVVASARNIGVVMMAAGGTAGCGFAALSALRIPTLTDFGLGVACGIFAAVVLEMTFMLALRALWPVGAATSGEGPLSRWLDRVLQPVESTVRRHPIAVVACFVAVAVAAAAGLPRLTTEYDSRAYWPERTALGRDLRLFDEHFPSTTTLTILLEGDPGAMKTPEAIRVMTGLQQAMAGDPDVGHTASIADIIRRTFEVFAPEEAGGGLPADAALIAQLFYLSESPAFQGFIDLTASRAVVRGFLNREDSRVTRRVIERLERYLEQNRPEHIRVALAGGVGPTLLALNEHTVIGKTLNMVILLAVILVIASVLLRTPLGGAYVVAPLVMALVVNLGFFSWLRIAFDLSGASIAAVGVGIGADYAIYFLYRLREEFDRTRDIDAALHTTMATSGRAVLFVALAMSAGFGVYLASDFYPLRVCGIFVPLTMLVSCLTALTLLPALVLLLRPRFILGESRAVLAKVQGVGVRS